MGFAATIVKNVLHDLGVAPRDQTIDGGRQSVGMNEDSFLEWLGISKKHKGIMSEITYFTCLKMLSETLAKMPIKYYQRTDKGSIDAH